MVLLIFVIGFIYEIVETNSYYTMNLAARVQQTNIVLKILPKWFSFDCFVDRFSSEKSSRHNLNLERKGFARPFEITYSLISQSLKLSLGRSLD